MHKSEFFGITVIIPSYNRQCELKRAIESVVTTQPSCIEILVIDDCSLIDPEPSLTAKNSSCVPVRYFRLAKNRGPQAARNLGIRRAKYNYVAFLDSDDAFSPDKVDVVLTALRKSPSDILFHAVSGMPSYRKLARFWYENLKSFIPFHWLIVFYNPIATPSLILRKKRKLGVEKFRYSEDWCYLLHYVDRSTTVCYLDLELAFVFRNAGSHGGLSGSLWRMRRGEFLAKLVLLRSPNIYELSRFSLGVVVGSIRVVSDFLRGRYWRK